MAAPKDNKNAIGNSGGKSLNDRKLAAEVRTLTLNKIKAILEMPEVKMKADDYELYKAILIKLSGTILPRLQYHSDGEGEALFPAPLSEDQLSELLRRRNEREETKEEAPKEELK